MSARAIALGGMLAGCIGVPKSTVVTDARIRGEMLVVTQCDLRANDDRLLVNNCHDVAQKLPTLVVHDTVDAPGAPSTQVEPLPPPTTKTGLAAIGAALSQCGPRYGLIGVVNVRLEIGPAGEVAAAVPNGGDDLASCLAAVLAGVRFTDHLGETFTVPIQVR